jgi:hypothetical protein
MLDVVPKVNQHKKLASHVEEIEAANTKGGEVLNNTNGKRALKKKLLQYYYKQEQLELVLAIQ